MTYLVNGKEFTNYEVALAYEERFSKISNAKYEVGDYVWRIGKDNRLEHCLIKQVEYRFGKLYYTFENFTHGSSEDKLFDSPTDIFKNMLLNIREFD